MERLQYCVQFIVRLNVVFVTKYSYFQSSPHSLLHCAFLDDRVCILHLFIHPFHKYSMNNYCGPRPMPCLARAHLRTPSTGQQRASVLVQGPIPFIWKALHKISNLASLLLFSLKCQVFRENFPEFLILKVVLFSVLFCVFCIY